MTTVNDCLAELQRLYRLELEGKDMSALIAKVNEQLHVELGKIPREKADAAEDCVVG